MPPRSAPPRAAARRSIRSSKGCRPARGNAFTVVLHMLADRKSRLADIISRWTILPVREAVAARLAA